MKIMTAIGETARWGVRKSLRLYYSRIEVKGRERRPADGAVSFVANHPNSLMDPALIGYTAQRPVHFFAKSPLFEVPVFGALLHALGMVPAYRVASIATWTRYVVRLSRELRIGAKVTRNIQAICNRPLLFPLPGGEGQGEGECQTNFSLPPSRRRRGTVLHHSRLLRAIVSPVVRVTNLLCTRRSG